jgi:hypothetical protein
MKTFFVVMPLILFPGLLVAEMPYRLGGKVSDPRINYPRKERKLDNLPVKTLPPTVNLQSQMPPVGDQNPQASCTGWAVGYFHKTHQEWIERGWNVNVSAHQFSPTFIYNQIDSGVDWGADLFDAFDLMMDHGCATLLQTPYTPYNCTTWPTEAAFDSALNYRILDWEYFNFGSDTGIAFAKQWLFEGKTFVFNIQAYTNLVDINDYDTCYCLANISGTYLGGHNICAVGYDDNRSTNDGTGAFRVANSWGPGWGSQGYFWVSYQAVKSSATVYPWAGYSIDRTGYMPRVKMRARLAHANRGSVNITAGIGPHAAPLWSKEFYAMGTGDGQYWMTGGNQPFPANNIVFDLSDGAAYLDSLGGTQLFLHCRDTVNDGQAGTIQHLSIEHTGWNVSAISYQTPVTIPNWYVDADAQVTLPPAGVGGGPTGVVGERRGFEVSAYPNPARTYLSIFCNRLGSKQATACLYDIRGRLVSLTTVQNGQTACLRLIDSQGQALSSGVYFLKADDGANSLVRKIAVLR